MTMKIFRIIRIALASWAAMYCGLVLALALFTHFELSTRALRVTVVAVLLSLATLLFEVETTRQSSQPSERETTR